MTPALRPLTRAVFSALHHQDFPSLRSSGKSKRETGFSLIETIVSAALVTILASGVYTLLKPTQGSYTISCVSPESFVVVRRLDEEIEVRAGTVVRGDELRLVNPGTGETRWGLVTFSHRDRAERVRITTERGITLTCSVSAPIGLEDGTPRLAKDLLHKRVAVEKDLRFFGDRVTGVLPLGEGEVQLITCEDDYFLAGDQSGRYLAHHNKKVGVCVDQNAQVRLLRQDQAHVTAAKDVHVGDLIEVMDPATGQKQWSRVRLSSGSVSEAVRLKTRRGITLTCSETAPIGLSDGHYVLSMDLMGCQIAVDERGAHGHDTVTEVKPMGRRAVQHIMADHPFFLVGDTEGHYVTHQ